MHLDFISPSLLVSVLLTWLLTGCAQQDFTMPEEFSPLGPVAITFESFTPDPAIETLLINKLGYPQGPFLLNGQGDVSERLHIFYKRQPDIKSIGLILLTGGLAPIEADYTYILQALHYSGNNLLRVFHYREQIRENTYSVFDDIFNPLYDPEGRSKEIFTTLCHRLLQDVMASFSAKSANKAFPPSPGL